MMYPIEYFVEMYVKEFPEQKVHIEEHIALNGMFLGHVFFDEAICGPLCRLLRKAQTAQEIKTLVTIIEAMLFEGDEYVKSVVTINILKKMKAEKDIYSKAKHHFSEALMQELEYHNKIG